MQTLKKWMLVAAGAVTLSGAVQATTYDIDTAHSQIGFGIRHMVSKTKGSFNDYTGTINFDAQKPEALSANVTIKTASVNTANEKRDEHLRSADFFNVEKFPEMTFKTTSVKSTGANKFEVTGDLTMLGVTKPVTLQAEMTGTIDDPWGNQRVGFTATGKLNRKDYGMVFNMAMDKGGVVLGDDVDLLIEAEGVAKKPEAAGAKSEKKKKK